MSRWTDQFENHPIHETLRQVFEWLDVEVDEIDSEHEAERRRLAKNLSLLQTVVEGLDEEIFPEPLVTNINNQLRQPNFWNQLNSYASNKNTQHLRTANDHISTQIPAIYQLAGLASKPEAKKSIQLIEAAFDKFTKALDSRDTELTKPIVEKEERLAALENKISELSKEHGALEESTESSFSTWQSEFTEAQTKRAEEFSTNQIERAKQFDAAAKEWNKGSESEISAISKKHDNALSKKFQDFSDQISDLQRDAESKHESILEIHRLVGNDGVAGGYQKGADDEKSAADNWRLVAMVSLGLAAIWVLVKFIIQVRADPNAAIDWSQLATAASLTLILLATAGYASRQSRIHRDNEQQLRWFALEIKAIDPFLSSLDPTQQKELRQRLSERLFGQDRSTTGHANESLNRREIKTVSDAVTGPLVEIVKTLTKT